MEWRTLFREDILKEAEKYVADGYVKDLTITEDQVSAKVMDSEEFCVQLSLADGTISHMECGCLYAADGGNCKHMAAAALAWENSRSSAETAEIETTGQIAVAEPELEKDGAEPESPVSGGLELTCEIDDVVTYAIVHNGGRIVRNIVVKNNSQEDMENLILKISGSSELIESLEIGIQKIGPGEEIFFRDLDISINADYLASLTEKNRCRLVICVQRGEEILVSETKDIVVLAFDQWPGLLYSPELLTAFSMPNHPVVLNLLQLAAQYLQKWTEDPSLAGYQFRDPNRVKHMAAAAYAAIQQKNITYAEPPSSFEMFGQRIRLADTVLDQHLGTCMDMTLLYVACLEAMGLNPIMVMMKGHIFAGVWLMEQSFSEMIMEDPSQLEKRMSKGIHELVVVECTAMCGGKTRTFDEAVALAERHVSNYRDFEFVIDVKRARSMGIHPLPIRVQTDDGFRVQHRERSEMDVTSAPKAVGEIFDLPETAGTEKVTKQAQWERKLLDLSLRNMLINMRMTKAVVPLLSPDVGTLEDALSDGEEFQVLARPADMAITGDGSVPVEMLGKLGPFQEFIALESKYKRLHSVYTEKELSSCLTKMYRSAKTSMEENGASTLYLALGLLRWYEGKNSPTARYAPIVLIPIDIVRKSAIKGYGMRMRDEDAQINITLLEFLKQNYDLRISGLNPPPTDEHGLDIPKIYTIILRAITNYPMWGVVEAGFIGNFSFSQFVMWNDIHNRKEFLENNKIVRSLMNGAVDWDCTIPDSVNTDEAYLPVTVDSSQLRAINMAAGGVSFVLHGPPGTGKSQTITAMVANALTKGKTVLFVAEKMAALEVVQKRLTALGIGDFCLELHSNKATKKAVLDQLKRGLEIGAWGTQTDYNKKIQDIRNMRADLDAYAKALHKKRPFGKSLRQLIDVYETLPEIEKKLWFDPSYAFSLTENDLDDQIHSLEKLMAAGKGVGHPHGHPLEAVYKTEYSQRMKLDLEPVMVQYQRDLEKLRDHAETFAGQMERPVPVTEKDWQELCGCAGGVVAAEKIPLFLRTAENLDQEFEIPFHYLEKKKEFAEKKESFISRWNENFLRMNMDDFRRKYEDANKKFFGKGKALAALTAEIQAYAAFPVETGRIPVYLTDVSFYQQEGKEMAEADAAFSYEWKEILRAYPTKEQLETYRDEVKRLFHDTEQLKAQLHKLDTDGDLQLCVQNAKAVLSAWNALDGSEGQAVELLGLRFSGGDENWLKKRFRLCACILENLDSMKDWIVYRKFEKECRANGLGVVCDAYERGLDHDKVIPVYLKSIYGAMILSVIEREPVLNGFTGTGFNEQIAQFKKLDQEFMELTKEEMFYQLTHQLPAFQTSVQVSRELNILRRAISSNGRGVSIRSLFEQIPTILTKLCPCMLMSPISAAQYLQPENDLFDIVIFDEASQMPTCKAVGVLARGKDAVIVGDPNQMPPTSFFAGNTVDEDNLDIEDLDSILDDCLALGMPQAHLQWHYRSRHESLIAFSNQEFYENSMFTFPSVNDREKRVRLVKVNGFFDRGRGRINEGEARAIVEEIKRRFQNPQLTHETVGVVTFNISQQTFIEDLLQEEYQKDAEFDKWANDGPEALFVKNLENVQGDERDVILFSIAFGPDAEGKLSLNFGPLNKNGGWKRLNVAVSRARSEMMVFTTMTADMINLKRTKSKGVEALKDFLEFAEKGRLQGEYVETRPQKDQGILEHICRKLSEAGYTYQKGVGHSKFKVDIAVTNPYNEDEYLLGIMLDGESYRQSANTKDREVAQIGVLKGLGWELRRIWTMDWWDNRDRELAKLLTLLEERKDIAYRKFLESHEESQESDQTAGAELAEAGLEEPAAERGEPETAADSAAANETALQVAEMESGGAHSSQQETDGGKQETPIVPAVEICLVSRETSLAEMDGKVASQGTVPEEPAIQLAYESPREYQVIAYQAADTEALELSSADYGKKENLSLIAEKMQQILDVEAPILYERLVKKTLRAFCISRSSSQTLEATDKALRKISAKMNKQAGAKFYWRKDQEPEGYSVYRSDADSTDKRTAEEICQQELKNAVCCTLCEKGPLSKEDLVRETIRTMGYGRSGAALTAAVERGLKYGRKTGEIVQNSEKKFELSQTP